MLLEFARELVGLAALVAYLVLGVVPTRERPPRHTRSGHPMPHDCEWLSVRPAVSKTRTAMRGSVPGAMLDLSDRAPGCAREFLLAGRESRCSGSPNMLVRRKGQQYIEAGHQA